MAPKGKDPRPKEPANRPGWKGPSFVKKPKSAPKTATVEKSVTIASNSLPSHPIPLELQQLLLNIFNNSFHDLLHSDDLASSLQEVKQALFERDFDTAFGEKKYLETYAARWSPSRALCYAQILADIQQYFTQMPTKSPLSGQKDQLHLSAPRIGFNTAIRVVCFGGGSAEVVAFGGLLSYLIKSSTLTPQENDISNTIEKAKPCEMKLLLVDIAAWGEVVENLSDGLTTPPVLSKYASASAKANNMALIPRDLCATSFKQADALSLSKPDISRMLGEEATLITLLFTLNELYTSSVSKTTSFLLHITAAAKPGTLLLVVDSPGSYSETAIGKDLKKYPMQWLLHHTLLEKTKLGGDGDSLAAWEKLVSQDSEWFRLAEKLRYPILLEDMRYQIHLYRRI